MRTFKREIQRLVWLELFEPDGFRNHWSVYLVAPSGAISVSSGHKGKKDAAKAMRRLRRLAWEANRQEQPHAEQFAALKYWAERLVERQSEADPQATRGGDDGEYQFFG